MAYSSSPCVLVLLLLLPFSLSAFVATAESHEYTPPPEKMTHLHFYFHEKYTSPEATAVLVAVPPGTNATFDTFGALIVIDDTLRAGPEESSKLIGRAQGLAAQASLEGTQILTAVNFVFTEGEYNGSTVAILGRIVPTVSPTERAIVGGSGKFRMARGRNLFAEVHQWALESFLALKSGKPRNAFEIQTPYPLLNDVICKQIPTAMILTKNAEFVDDMLTFQELGEHLKSKGCHIANLSAMDFCAKDGIAGCLRSLLRQLVMDAPDMADMSVLSSWYCEPENYDHPVIIVIDDMERCSGVILADFIRLLSEWVIKLPVIFIMGVATTDTAKKLLPSDALQHLQSSKFTLGSPLERMNAIVEAVLVKPSFGFNIGHNVAVFMRNYFLGHDGTITSFVRALKLACVKHFSMEPLSFLGIDILDENQVFLHGKCDALPDSLLKYAFNLPSCKRGKDCKNSRDDLGEGLSDLRKLLKAWSSVILCLYEVGKHNKIQLLDIFCEATDPTLSSLDPSNHKLERSFNGQNLAEGRLDFKGGLIGQLIHTVRELPLSSLIKLLDSWSIHIEELCEVHGEVRELQSVVKSSNGGNNLKERQIDCHRMSMSLCAGRTSLSVNGKAAALLDNMVRKFLMPIECLCFHEIICFRNVDILQSALIGNPRRNIQVDLMKSTTYIKCSCCSSNGNVLSPTMHDTSVMYNLAQEHGDLINLQDWYHSFKSTVLGTNKLKCPLQHSPMSKKVKSSPSESEASIQARFCRAVIELQIAGLFRMPSKKRPDFVQRVAFGL